MKFFRIVLCAVAAVACGGADTAPSTEVTVITGAWCASLNPTVARSSTGATVTIYSNGTKVTDTTDNGVITHHEQRSCNTTKTCNFGVATANASSDSQLVTACQATA
jgi:hypothetical protein